MNVWFVHVIVRQQKPVQYQQMPVSEPAHITYYWNQHNTNQLSCLSKTIQDGSNKRYF